MHRGLRRTWLIALLFLAACPMLVHGQNLKSGPPPGTADKPSYVPAPFHPFNATGDRKGKYHCLVCRYGLRPVVVVFARQVPKADDPLAVLLQKLDAAVNEHQDVRLAAFAVFLTDVDEVGRAALVTELETLE